MQDNKTKFGIAKSTSSPNGIQLKSLNGQRDLHIPTNTAEILSIQISPPPHGNWTLYQLEEDIIRFQVASATGRSPQLQILMVNHKNK